MPAKETPGNATETVSDDALAATMNLVWDKLIEIEAKLDHMDEGLHEVRQFIDANKPLLEKFTRPGGLMGGMFRPLPKKP